MKSIDMAEILLEAYKLADHINESEEVRRYLELKERLATDPEARRLIREFQRKKEKFEECQRFGHYHPDYHAARKEAEAFQEKMAQHPLIGAFLKAEEELDRLLYEVSRTIAHAVSESVRVPVNDPRPIKKKKATG